LAKQMVAAAEASAPTNEDREDRPSVSAASPAPFEALKHLLSDLATAAERLPFNVVCRGPQQLAWVEIPMAQIGAIKEACEATVNDVVLTALTLAARRYARLHGVPLTRRQLRVAVPVSVRRNPELAELGNHFSFLPVSIPLDLAAPRDLLHAVQEAVGHGRAARVSELVSLLGTVLGAIPSAVQALLGPIMSQLPLSLCNLICTNIPGPPAPLYLLGHRLLACYPYVPIGGEMGMNCAVLSYNGTAYFGLTGDVHAIPDLESLAKSLRASFARLRQAAGVREATPTQRTRSESPSAVPGADLAEGKAPESSAAAGGQQALRAGAGGIG